MVDYYKILNVKRTATATEIKSAYRRLARLHHPDVNNGSPASSREFALIARAYRILGDPPERARYDERTLRALHNTDSIFDSDNPYMRRMRRAAVQARWDRTVDDWLEADRLETFARTKAVFTTVTLFFSTFIVATLKPRLWEGFSSMGRSVMVILFLIGVWHLIVRLRECFANYTYQPKLFQESIMRDEEPEQKPYTRLTATAFLIVGYIASLAAGLLVGSHIYYILSDMAELFSPTLRATILLYPPIAVLIVDTMHTVASKVE
ncbi:MAG: hypothetical protein NVSMB56_01570 [Pyrinomonadaceae bacterium]